VVTFARFYGMHVLLLPPVTSLLIVLHVYLVRKTRRRAAPEDEPCRPRNSIRSRCSRHVAVFIAFVILFGMAVLVHIPLERIADPTTPPTSRGRSGISCSCSRP